MRNTLRVLFVILFCGLAPPGHADSETRVKLVYEIYFGGLHVGSISLRAEISQQRYRLVAATRSTGLIDTLIGFSSEAETVGRLDNGNFKPEWYETNGIWISQVRRVRNDYDSDGRVRNQAVPSAQEDDRDRVTPEQMTGALDPLSAGLTAVHAAAHGRCRQRLPVFDGRRRYDLSITGGHPDQIAGPFYSGPAFRCSVRLERQVGFSRKPWIGAGAVSDTSHVWIAKPAPDLPAVPVRMRTDAGPVVAIVHLVRIDRDFELATPAE